MSKWSQDFLEQRKTQVKKNIMDTKAIMEEHLVQVKINKTRISYLEICLSALEAMLEENKETDDK